MAAKAPQAGGRAHIDQRVATIARIGGHKQWRGCRKVMWALDRHRDTGGTSFDGIIDELVKALWRAKEPDFNAGKRDIIAPTDDK